MSDSLNDRIARFRERAVDDYSLDEAWKVAWKLLADCQRRMEQLGLQVDELRFKLSEAYEREGEFRAENRNMLEALKEVDRLYSDTGGGVISQQYKLIANHDDCGPMINAVRAAIEKAEAGHKGGPGE